MQLLLTRGALPAINQAHVRAAPVLPVLQREGEQLEGSLVLNTSSTFAVIARGFIRLLCFIRQVDGAIPLYVACQNGHGVVVSILLNHGASVSQAKVRPCGMPRTSASGCECC